MKLTRRQLKQIIKEELAQVLRETETCIPKYLEACAEDFRTTVALNLPKYCAMATARNVGPIVYSCELLTLEVAIEDIEGPTIAAAEKCLDRFAKVAIEQGMKLCVGAESGEGLDIQYEIKSGQPLYTDRSSKSRNNVILAFIMRNKYIQPGDA